MCVNGNCCFYAIALMCACLEFCVKLPLLLALLSVGIGRVVRIGRLSGSRVERPLGWQLPRTRERPVVAESVNTVLPPFAVIREPTPESLCPPGRCGSSRNPHSDQTRTPPPFVNLLHVTERINGTSLPPCRCRPRRLPVLEHRSNEGGDVGAWINPQGLQRSNHG